MFLRAIEAASADDIMSSPESNVPMFPFLHYAHHILTRRRSATAFEPTASDVFRPPAQRLLYCRRKRQALAVKYH
jgi:hypothetical protein